MNCSYCNEPMAYQGKAFNLMHGKCLKDRLRHQWTRADKKKRKFIEERVRWIDGL